MRKGREEEEETAMVNPCKRTLALYRTGVPMDTPCRYAYTGRVPCTGPLVCTMCGERKEEPERLVLAAVTKHTVAS